MKFLNIGLGSMGKRRLRNLHALGHRDIVGFDPSEARRKEAEEKYQIKTTGHLTPELMDEREFFIISTPPDRHLEYLQLGVQHKKPTFVEASVLSDGLSEVAMEAHKQKVIVAPSCTLRFHPLIKVIRELVKSGRYGAVCNFSYHMGQYLPDWHPWEHPRDFYVGQKKTSAGREMVPFEMTWLVDVVGIPREVTGFHGGTHDMGVDIDDTYSVSMRLPGKALGTLTVDVVSRFATRSLILNMERGQIRWNWEEKIVKLFDANTKNWVHYFQPEGQAAVGYNVNILEEMYVEELGRFIHAAKGGAAFPNTLSDDIKVLSILEKSESTNRGAVI